MTQLVRMVATALVASSTAAALSSTDTTTWWTSTTSSPSPRPHNTALALGVEAQTMCAPFTLPALGTLVISPGNMIVLENPAVFTPHCSSSMPSSPAVSPGASIPTDVDITSIVDVRDPFHASITPQAYATGAATVIAWMLVIVLIITPRTFYTGGPSGASGLMGRRGLIGGANGGASITGVGTRPWLQKVAALTVAISLSLATADTYRIAQRQYNAGYMDASQLRNEVVAGTEIKVSRVISDIFIWLAQVQTLIRLFPRHKEKVIIKWVGFALILLDITFSCLNSFGSYSDKPNPRRFDTAIPALSYLFQLSLSMLYAAWVVYYALTKRRYAFYHSMMWNMTLVALLSIVAILTPVVFFITDISNYTIAGWGDYFRWVGAAAASVLVWEWVERIEALEREERKDGILGREIYDGDEMLDTTPSQEVNWPGAPKHTRIAQHPPRRGPATDAASGGGFASAPLARLNHMANRLGRTSKEQTTAARKRRTVLIPAQSVAARQSDPTTSARPFFPPQGLPGAVASPVSRTDTTSADSTVYTVRYHPLSEPVPIITQPTLDATPAREPMSRPRDAVVVPIPVAKEDKSSHSSESSRTDPEKGDLVIERKPLAPSRSWWSWQTVANVHPFRRKGRTPPAEVQRGRVIEPLAVQDVTLNIPQRNYDGFALKDRLGTFAARQGDRFRKTTSATQQTEQGLPVTIIPAQPRGRTWSPDILLQQQQNEQQQQQQHPSQPVASPATAGGVVPSDLPPDSSRVVSPIPEEGDEPFLVPGVAHSGSSMRVVANTPLPPANAQDEGPPTLRPGSHGQDEGRTDLQTPHTRTDHDR